MVTTIVLVILLKYLPSSFEEVPDPFKSDPPWIQNNTGIRSVGGDVESYKFTKFGT